MKAKSMLFVLGLFVVLLSSCAGSVGVGGYYGGGYGGYYGPRPYYGYGPRTSVIVEAPYHRGGYYGGHGWHGGGHGYGGHGYGGRGRR